MPDSIDLSKLLDDPSISPEMRAFAEKLKAFATPKKKLPGHQTHSHKFYNKLEEYYLEIEFTCLCCGNKWKTMFFMADQHDGTLKGEETFLFGDDKPKTFKTKQSTVFTCRDCTTRLYALSQEELVKRHFGFFSSMIGKVKSMPRKKKFQLRYINNGKEDTE